MVPAPANYINGNFTVSNDPISERLPSSLPAQRYLFVHDTPWTFEPPSAPVVNPMGLSLKATSLNAKAWQIDHSLICQAPFLGSFRLIDHFASVFICMGRPSWLNRHP
jgi:hypothetical protein